MHVQWHTGNNKQCFAPAAAAAAALLWFFLGLAWWRWCSRFTRLQGSAYLDSRHSSAYASDGFLDRPRPREAFSISTETFKGTPENAHCFPRMLALELVSAVPGAWSKARALVNLHQRSRDIDSPFASIHTFLHCRVQKGIGEGRPRWDTDTKRKLSLRQAHLIEHILETSYRIKNTLRTCWHRSWNQLILQKKSYEGFCAKWSILHVTSANSGFADVQKKIRISAGGCLQEQSQLELTPFPSYNGPPNLKNQKKIMVLARQGGCYRLVSVEHLQNTHGIAPAGSLWQKYVVVVFFSLFFEKCRHHFFRFLMQNTCCFTFPPPVIT